MIERARDRIIREKEEEKRGIERGREELKRRRRKITKIIKNIIEILIILVFLFLLFKLYTLLTKYQDVNNSTIPEENISGTPITLTFQEIMDLCGMACNSEGGFGNIYYNSPNKVQCVCGSLHEDGTHIMKVFNKITRKWEN
jgi:cell division protein FtsL